MANAVSMMEKRIMESLVRMLDARLPPPKPMESAKIPKAQVSGEGRKGPAAADGSKKKEEKASTKSDSKMKKAKMKKGGAKVGPAGNLGVTTTCDPRSSVQGVIRIRHGPMRRPNCPLRLGRR